MLHIDQLEKEKQTLLDELNILKSNSSSKQIVAISSEATTNLNQDLGTSTGPVNFNSIKLLEVRLAYILES